MARYSMIRGWIECSFDNVADIREIVTQHWTRAPQYVVSDDAATLYLSGWTFPESPINWTSFVFFGASVNELAVPFIRDCLSRIIQSGLEVRGFFHVDDEERENLRVWSFEDGKWSENPRES